ncbi:hypothetical protein [Sorangium sp. So ce363]|uniref:hypothetical protein n=1 Tax=Sorangium sp. So ce363 TaxID=3133304 RepID=UPI003F611323
MKVVIDDAVFTGPSFVMDMLLLFQLALERRHRIIVDEAGTGYTTWLAGLGRDAQEECRLALEESAEAEAREPARREIRVVCSGTDWDGAPPTVTLAEATRLLRRPFRVLVENRGNDFRFLLTMANDAQRAELEERQKQEWLAIEHGGGITEMEGSVQEWKRDPIKRLTLWVLFDSDARRAGQPSAQARKLSAACGRRVPHHMLKRRAIENYVTRNALEEWGEAKDMQERVEAFYAMPTQDHRSFFNMKHGLRKDARSADGIAEDLYGAEALDVELRRRLDLGFGPRLRDVFGDGRVRTADLIADGTFAEVNGAITELLAWMR